ncbi:alpha/beta hydrolase [Zoogloea dura]|jgi:pimeloyl-ACP methyl ester carboxylesterase|uniref:Alpha/beta hydrolase n=1 Tax=Zoogloea dura TaxID=2728840 RepID=A0A848G4S7_9RHOO|nr:alpha/beta hydrolase [Zoogloea dura]NML26259.1 alpha/beta hydrolase [Zoogloea dura]
MNRSRFGDLEVLCRAPSVPSCETPLLFVHGAYTGAWCWDEYFLKYFASKGYSSYAVSLSGHGGSRGGAYLDSFSIADYVDDVAEVVGKLPVAPVLIGHSMGGMVVQKYLEKHSAPAVVLISSVPPQGLLGSAFGLAFSKPGLLGDLNRIMGGGQPQMETLRHALFHEAIELERLQRYYHLCQPESHRAIWDMSLFDLPFVSRMQLPPMLVMGAQHDVLIPPEQVRMTAQRYGVDSLILPGLGHGMMMESDWQQAADPIVAWLKTLDL